MKRFEDNQTKLPYGLPNIDFEDINPPSIGSKVSESKVSALAKESGIGDVVENASQSATLFMLEVFESVRPAYEKVKSDSMFRVEQSEKKLDLEAIFKAYDTHISHEAAHYLFENHFVIHGQRQLAMGRDFGLERVKSKDCEPIL